MHPSDNTSSRMTMARSASDASMTSNRTPSSDTTPGSQRSAVSQNSQLIYQQNSQHSVEKNYGQNSRTSSSMQQTANQNLRTSSSVQQTATQNSSHTQQRSMPSPSNAHRQSPAHTPIKVQSKVEVNDWARCNNSFLMLAV